MGSLTANELKNANQSKYWYSCGIFKSNNSITSVVPVIQKIEIMATPTIADKQPKPVELEAGKTYAWCSCGTSSNQPFCDGSHKGSEFNPVAYKAEATKKMFFCACKQTNNPPFCDGSHNK